MDFLRTYTLEIVLGLAVLVVLEFLMLASQNGRINRLHKLLRSMLTGPEGEDLATQLQRSMQESSAALQQGQMIETQLQSLQHSIQNCVQLCGMVRYDAYGDVSGQQSFSLAMLDGNHHGTIITTLYGRHDTRCFGKVITNGESAQVLSDEETEALAEAIRSTLPGPASAPKVTAKRRFLKRSSQD